MLEAITSGADLAEFVTRMTITRASVPDLLGAAVGVLIDCYQTAILAGWVPVVGNTFPAAMQDRSANRMRIDLVQCLNSNDVAAQSEQLSFLVTAIHWLRQAGCTWALTTTSTHPLPVSIVSMPDRVKTTNFQRDLESHEILSSVQTERDLQTA